MARHSWKLNKGNKCGKCGMTRVMKYRTWGIETTYRMKGRIVFNETDPFGNRVPECKL